MVLYFQVTRLVCVPVALVITEPVVLDVQSSGTSIHSRRSGDQLDSFNSVLEL